MKTNNKTWEIFRECVAHWGETSQILMAIEELGELSVVLCHSLRANKPFDMEHITEEMADVQLILDQLQFIFNITDVELISMRHKKLNRLIELLQTEKEILKDE